MITTKAPNSDDQSSATTIFIVCGFLVGVGITVLLFCLMVCKLKLHRAKKDNDKKETVKVKTEKNLQFIRTAQTPDGQTNLKKWRSGYGDEESGLAVEDAERNPLASSDNDLSSNGTISGANDTCQGARDSTVMSSHIVNHISEA